ncbi:MAG: tetratricopeptide repeat protein [Phycisphaeraceae bacterium]
MATRINTKFVITLASLLVLLVLAFVFAFTFLKKDAEDHARNGDAAMDRAQAALEANDIPRYNSELQRAANHYGSAKSDDPTNTEYLYGYVKAHGMVLCSNLTTANNQLESELAGAEGIHDTIGATNEDRAFYYELVHERSRVPVIVNKRHPIAAMRQTTLRRLDVQSDDPVALVYHAIGESFTAEQKTDDQDAAKTLEQIKSAADANPDNPWLQSALARYHLGNGRRLFRAEGNSFTDKVANSFALAQTHALEAMKIAGEDNVPAYVEAAGVLSQLRSNDKAQTGRFLKAQQQTAEALRAMLAERSNRDQLFIEEVGRAIAIMRSATTTGDAETQTEAFDGQAAGLELAKAIVEDRPDHPGAYQTLGQIYFTQNNFEEAEKTTEKGLNIERPTNAMDFVRDQQARIGMLSILSDVKITLAQQAGKDEARREALLKVAQDVIDQLTDAQTTRTDWRDARISFLKGRIALANNKPRQAVTHLERANQAYNRKDAMTLRLLAQTHTQLGNEGLVVDFYETIVTTLQPTATDLLNLINIYLTPGDNQQLDRARTQLEWYRGRFPEDIRAVRLEARLLQAEDKTVEAIALLEKQDLEKHPELMEMIVNYQAQTGDTDAAIDLMRQRIAARPQGASMDLDLVTRLLNMLPDQETKLAEIETLKGQGLNPDIAAVIARLMTTGRPTLEDELELIDAQASPPAETAMRKFLAYQRWNQPVQAKAQLAQAIELDPDMPRAIEWRFRLAMQDERWDDADAAIRDMLDLEPEERTNIALANGRFMRAQVLAMQGAAMQPGEARNNKFREATVAYNNALQQYSHYVEGWVQLGRLYLVQGNFFAAQDALVEALTRQSRNVEALTFMARAEIGAGDTAAALERYAQVLEIQPTNTDAIEQFTALAQQLGVPERAVALREQIRDRVPGNRANRRALALLYADADAHEQAKQEVQAAIESEGNTRENVAAMSRVLSLADEGERSVRVVQDYLAQLTEAPDWRDHLLLAQAYVQTDQPEQADGAFRKAVAAEKADGSSLSAQAWGRLMVRRGEIARAAALYEGLTENEPENDDLKLQTATLYLQVPDYDKAEAIAKKLPASAERSRLLIQSASAQDGKLGLAIQRARQAVDDYPSDFSLRLNLIELLRAKEDATAVNDRDYTSLLSMARKLQSDHPERVEAMVAVADILLRLRRDAQALAQLEAALEFAPGHVPSAQRIFAIKLSRAQALSTTDPAASQSAAGEALAIARRLVQARPNNAALQRSAAQAAVLANQGNEAAAYFGNTFNLTRSVQDLASYANVLLSTDQADVARAVLEDGENASLVSNNMVLRAMRGRALAGVGLNNQATTLFRNVLKDAETPADRVMLARQLSLAFAAEPMRGIELLDAEIGAPLPIEIESIATSMLMARRDYANAIKRLLPYQSNPVSDPNAQFFLMMQLALSQQESGQLTEAKASYDLAYDLMRDNTDTIPKRQRKQMLNNLAYLLADQLTGYENDAVKYAREAMTLMGDDVPPREIALIEDTLGWALFKSGKIDEAIQTLKRSVDKFPLAANQLHLGQAYLAKGDKDRALIVLEDARDMARSENDAKMIELTEKWYREAL